MGKAANNTETIGIYIPEIKRIIREKKQQFIMSRFKNFVGFEIVPTLYKTFSS